MWAIHISLQAQHRRAVCNLKHNKRTQQPHHSQITAWALEDLNEKWRTHYCKVMNSYVNLYICHVHTSADLNVKNQYGITSLEAFMYGIQKNTL